jgi:hypothetical protein
MHTESGKPNGAYGLVLVCFDYSKTQLDEFNDWYDTEHIPERERTGVMLRAQRWLVRDDPRISVAAYDLDRIESVRGPEYLAITGDNQSPWSKRMIGMCTQLLRFEGRQMHPGTALGDRNAKAMLMVGVDAPVERCAYSGLADRMVRAPGVVSARIFEGTNNSIRFLEVYEFESAQTARSDGWQRASAAALDGVPNLASRAKFVWLCDRYVRSGGDRS